MSVELEQHPFEAFFEYLRAVVRHRPYRIRIDTCLRILRHYEPILVILIRYGKGIGFECIEQTLFRVAVVIKGLVVVDMIAREVGE